jgi:ribonuclease Z
VPEASWPDRFFFDFGPGCVKNILAMGAAIPNINDIFISHLHVDHHHDLSCLLPLSTCRGRWTMPLRVTGRTPELGTKAMAAGMSQYETDAQVAFGSVRCLPSRARA